jgi:hypothetical protein
VRYYCNYSPPSAAAQGVSRGIQRLDEALFDRVLVTPAATPAVRLPACRAWEPKPLLRNSEKHIDAVAGTARLHQQRRALPAQRRAGDQPDALLSVVSTISAMPWSSHQSVISRPWPASGT